MGSGLPEDNSPTFYVLVLLMAIVVAVVLWGASTPPFTSKGVEVTKKVT
jgi:hypothetical protein